MRAIYAGNKYTKPTKFCAYCRFHRTYLTVKQLKKKDCIKKECYHFHKIETHAYWKAIEKKKNDKKMRKEKI